MRTLTTLGLSASTALIGLGVAAPATATVVTADPAGNTAETIRERGIVLDCHGTIAGRPVYASVYENDVYGNVVQVVVGERGDRVGNSRSTTEDFLVDREVRATVRVDGHRAVVLGTARRVGKRTPVHEQYDDAGHLVTVDGTHRRLRNDLRLRWAGNAADLSCGDAFAYDLQVTKEPIED